jgi:hypothetical protein
MRRSYVRPARRHRQRLADRLGAAEQALRLRAGQHRRADVVKRRARISETNGTCRMSNRLPSTKTPSLTLKERSPRVTIGCAHRIDLVLDLREILAQRFPPRRATIGCPRPARPGIDQRRLQLVDILDIGSHSS